MFSADPGTLRHIPRSEYRKRRDYWRLVKSIDSRVTTGPGGVTIEKTGIEIESDAVIIGEDT